MNGSIIILMISD